MNCDCCGHGDGFHALNPGTSDYSGIELALCAKGMLRARRFDEKGNMEAQDVVNVNFCPICGRALGTAAPGPAAADDPLYHKLKPSIDMLFDCVHAMPDGMLDAAGRGKLEKLRDAWTGKAQPPLLREIEPFLDGAEPATEEDRDLLRVALRAVRHVRKDVLMEIGAEASGLALEIQGLPAEAPSKRTAVTELRALAAVADLWTDLEWDAKEAYAGMEPRLAAICEALSALAREVGDAAPERFLSRTAGMHVLLDAIA